MRQCNYRDKPSNYVRVLRGRVIEGKWFRKKLFIQNLPYNRYCIYETFISNTFVKVNRHNYIQLLASPKLLLFYR